MTHCGQRFGIFFKNRDDPSWASNAGGLARLRRPLAGGQQIFRHPQEADFQTPTDFHRFSDTHISLWQGRMTFKHLVWGNWKDWEYSVLQARNEMWVSVIHL